MYNLLVLKQVGYTINLKNNLALGTSCFGI